MLLDVKQKSESDADILLSFDQSNCKVGSKSVLADWAPTCWRGPVTCERGRNASLKCVSPALLAYEPRANAMALAVELSWDPTPRLR